MTVFYRLLRTPVPEKASALRDAVRSTREQHAEVASTIVFDVPSNAFGVVPGGTFAYWVSDSVRSLFSRLPPMASEGRAAQRTNSVDDNFRFARLHWEIRLSGADEPTWVPWPKGGAFKPFYYDPDTVIAWSNARWTYPGFLGTPSRPLERPASADLFFRPGLTWPLRSQRGLSVRVMPAGCVFGAKAGVVVVPGDEPDSLLGLLSVMSSSLFSFLVELQMAVASYEVGVIQRTPVPELAHEDVLLLARHARRAWSLQRALDSTNETSHAFLLPPGLNEKCTGLDRGAAARELEMIQKQIDDAAFHLYGIGQEDRAAIEASSGCAAASNDASEDSGDDVDDDSSEDVTPIGAAADAAISWLVGVAFGRFDPRLATAERPVPPEPEPFKPLPLRSLGMWPDGDAPAQRPDILVDDQGHSDDVIARVRAIAERVHCELPENVRGWLAKEFFPLHVKMYSKSRRRAPIYWQLATASASYSVWVYIHAFTRDTLFRVQNDYVAPKLAHEERRLESLTSELRDGPTANQRKALAAQESVIEELRAFLDEVKRVAPLWNPNLDDGVIINFGPLWRLVPQNKSWRKEVKSTWDALCEGRYDWAHLAMHLWPERVVPKCAKDRSLAIAHGLENVFWVEGSDGKWTARKIPSRSVNDLVRERTSPAVKSALKSLLEAPIATGESTGRGRGARHKASAAADDGGDA
jgi:hypothetical protein